MGTPRATAGLALAARIKISLSCSSFLCFSIWSSCSKNLSWARTSLACSYRSSSCRGGGGAGQDWGPQLDGPCPPPSPHPWRRPRPEPPRVHRLAPGACCPSRGDGEAQRAPGSFRQAHFPVWVFPASFRRFHSTKRLRAQRPPLPLRVLPCRRGRPGRPSCPAVRLRGEQDARGLLLWRASGAGTPRSTRGVTRPPPPAPRPLPRPQPGAGRGHRGGASRTSSAGARRARRPQPSRDGRGPVPEAARHLVREVLLLGRLRYLLHEVLQPLLRGVRHVAHHVRVQLRDAVLLAWGPGSGAGASVPVPTPLPAQPQAAPGRAPPAPTPWTTRHRQAPGGELPAVSVPAAPRVHADVGGCEAGTHLSLVSVSAKAPGGGRFRLCRTA